MFCSKCGNELAENEKFCTNCGAQVSHTETLEVPEQAVNETTAVETEAANISPENQAVPGTETGFVPEGMEQPEQEQPKKKRKWVKALIAAIAVVCATAVAFAFPAVRNLFFRTVMSPEDYFKYVVENNIEDMAKNFAGYTSELKKANLQAQSATGNFEITVGDKAKELVKKYGEGVNIDWLNSVNLSVDSTIKDGKMSAGYGIKLNNKDITTANILMDGDYFYISAPDVNSKALRMDMSEYSTGDINTFGAIEEIVGIIPDEKVVEDLMVRYTMSLVEGIDNVSEETVTVSAGGVSKKYLKMSAKIDDNTAEEALKAVLTEVKNDEEIEKIIKDACKTELIDQDGDEVYDEFMDTVDDALDELDDDGISYDTDVYFNIWVDLKGDIIGFGFDAEEDGNEASFVYQNVRRGKKLGTIAEFKVDGGTSIAFEGSGEAKSNKFSGTYSLSVEADDFGGHLLDIEIENVDIKLMKDNLLNGKIVVKPSEDLVNLMEITGEAAELVSQAELVLEVETTDENNGKMKLSAYTQGGLLGTISTDATTAEAKKISAPGSYVDMTDDAAMEAWAEESVSNLNSLIDKLENAGLPAEYASMMRESIAPTPSPSEMSSEEIDMNAYLAEYGIWYDSSDDTYIDMETGEYLTVDDVLVRLDIA